MNSQGALVISLDYELMWGCCEWSTPEEYGKYMIQKSGRFDYDENLDAFYDYEKYGTERMNEEDGMFTDRGYIAYKGYISMEEVMNGGQSNHMVMGGLSQ